MTEQIGKKEQISQRTILDTNARDNIIQLSEIIDGTVLVITFRPVLSLGIEDYKTEITSQAEGQKVIVEIRLFGHSNLPDEVWSKDSIPIFQHRNGENILTTYFVDFYVKRLLSRRWPGVCLYHFFLYKKTETLPPVTR